MNTYLPIELGPGNWAIEQFVDGAPRGLTLGRYEDKAAASYIANVYVRMETMEAARQ